MKSKLILVASAAMLMVGAALPADAALLNFNLTGSRDAFFQLDSNPMPNSFSSSSLIGDQIGFTNVSGTYGGVPGTASIGFGTGLIAALNVGSTSLGFTQFAGPALFSGPASSPIFSTGVFNLTSIVSGASTLTISDAAVSGVPEPSIWATLIAGLGLMGFALRRHRSTRGLVVAD
jgi:hypothetical protein